ncbi:hypothetical protein F5888DRAFT_604225 [Russula emetica]|nr:hypothetical protein F5888DRAFT_604225 [Russula emetica]
MICLAFTIVPIVFTFILTCELESYVIFVHSLVTGLQTSLSASEQFHRICQTTHHTQSHQWISSLSSSPSPPTPPRPSPPPVPLMQLQPVVVAALLRRWSRL